MRTWKFEDCKVEETMTRKYIRQLLKVLTYTGGVNGDTDVYQYHDPHGDMWEIEVDRHDDDGYELSDDEIAAHATCVRHMRQEWTVSEEAEE